MANKKNWMWMPVLVLVFGMTAVGCDNNSADGSNDPKTIIITGIPEIPGINGRARIELYPNYDIWIEGNGWITNNSVSLPLSYAERGWEWDRDAEPWTGSGAYYLRLKLFYETDGHSDSFFYTNGKTFPELGLSKDFNDADFFAKAPKYNISTPTSTIAFNKFKANPYYDDE